MFLQDKGNNRFDERMLETINPNQGSDCPHSQTRPFPSSGGQPIQRCIIIRRQSTWTLYIKIDKMARKEKNFFSKELMKNRHHKRNYPKTAVTGLTK